MKVTRLIALSVALTCLSFAACGQGKPAPKDAVLYFVWPQDGATIKGGFWCRFGLRNMGVTHAGDNFPNSGHHHLLIDVSEPIDPNEPIPQDKSHLHFGAGQTEARIELPPGKHTLQLVLGDENHYPFNPPIVSDKITIRITGVPQTNVEVAPKRPELLHEPAPTAASAGVAAAKAKAAMCAGCHGQKGEGVPPFPALASKPEAEQIKALKDFKSGSRANPIMNGIAATLSDADMENLAAYFSSFK
jgi:cytochrome c553